jgi:hypothetical protein
VRDEREGDDYSFYNLENLPCLDYSFSSVDSDDLGVRLWWSVVLAMSVLSLSPPVTDIFLP